MNMDRKTAIALALQCGASHYRRFTGVEGIQFEGDSLAKFVRALAAPPPQQDRVGAKSFDAWWPTMGQTIGEIVARQAFAAGRASVQPDSGRDAALLQNAELVHERLKDIRHLGPGTHASALAREALPCIRAIIASQQGEKGGAA